MTWCFPNTVLVLPASNFGSSIFGVRLSASFKVIPKPLIFELTAPILCVILPVRSQPSSAVNFGRVPVYTASFAANSKVKPVVGATAYTGHALAAAIFYVSVDLPKLTL